MPRFPFGSRPTPRRPQQQHPMRTMQPQSPPSSPMGYGDILKYASFSPELSFLLAMTMKDGMNRQSALEMLKKIEPYVSNSDKEAIHSIFNAQYMTDEYRRNPPAPPPGRSGTGLNSFSRLARQQALLDVLSGYAGSDTKSMMQGLSQSARMQENFERMTRRMEKLRNMNASSPEQMFEALSMFMPPEEQGKFRNMQNMMRMMGNMGNFKPEDMFKFMGNMGGMGNTGSPGNTGNNTGYNSGYGAGGSGNMGNNAGYNSGYGTGSSGNMGSNAGYNSGYGAGSPGNTGNNNMGNNQGYNSGYGTGSPGGMGSNSGYNTGGGMGNMGGMGNFGNMASMMSNMGGMGGNMGNMMNMMNMMGNMMGGKRK